MQILRMFHSIWRMFGFLKWIGIAGVCAWQFAEGASIQNVFLGFLTFMIAKHFIWNWISPFRRPGVIKTIVWICVIFGAIGWLQDKLGVDFNGLIGYAGLSLVAIWGALTVIGATLSVILGSEATAKEGERIHDGPGGWVSGALGPSQHAANARRRRRVQAFKSMGFGKWCGFFAE